MRHGGPDDEGVYLDDKVPLALGHRRLALIDLSSAGHQPMHNPEKSVQLIFNGEIYNFRELRNTLQAYGHRFETATDTEVILKAYLQWGRHCFEKFNGMFALAIYDKRHSEIILARDHAGIKPLYYSILKNKLVFASEIRAFKTLDIKWPENPGWKIAFLTFGHLPEPFTTLQHVEPLKKGSCLVIQLPSLRTETYSFNHFQFSNAITDAATAVSLVKEKLEKAVERHLFADAPVGLFLSGGVDSSLLTLLAHKHAGDNLKTLSIVFNDVSLNEQPYQQLVIEKTRSKHHSFLVTEEEFGRQLPDILQAMDQPSTDGINAYFICKYAHQYGLTAALSGLGADELFGGYNSFSRTRTAGIIQKALPAFIPGLASYLPKDSYKKISFLKRKDLKGTYLFNRGFFSTRQVAELLNTSENNVTDIIDKVTLKMLPHGSHPKNKASWLESNLYMQNQLLKDIDYMSMWHSLEVRVPFLDKELIETVFSIAPEIKYGSKAGKHLLIQAFNTLLPKEIWQRKKKGFTFPFSRWMHRVQSTERTDSYRRVRSDFELSRMHWSKYWAYLLCEHPENVQYFKPDAKRILFLNLAAFSIIGGIEKINRYLLKALGDFQQEGNLIADAVSIYDSACNENYFHHTNYKGFNKKKVSFVLHAISKAKSYDIIIVGHINMALPVLLIKLLYPSKKVFLVAHGIELWTPLKGIRRAAIMKVDKILSISSYTKKQILRIQHIPPHKVFVLQGSLDPYFRFPRQFKKPTYLKERYNLNGEKVLYTFTRLSGSEQYKGYDKVLEILPGLKKHHTHIKYILAGKADAKEQQRVKQMIADLNLKDSVILTGFIKDEEVTDHYLLADAFIMPSTMEGFGLVFIEAMSCGLPVIAGNVDGSADALKNGELGTLVNPFDGNQIIHELTNILNKTGSDDMSAKVALQNKVINEFGFNSFKKRLEAALC